MNLNSVFNVNKGFVSKTAVIDEEIIAQASVNMFPILFLRNSDFYAFSPSRIMCCVISVLFIEKIA
jgi:hypothetical protein